MCQAVNGRHNAYTSLLDSHVVSILVRSPAQMHQPGKKRNIDATSDESHQHPRRVEICNGNGKGKTSTRSGTYSYSEFTTDYIACNYRTWVCPIAANAAKGNALNTGAVSECTLPVVSSFPRHRANARQCFAVKFDVAVNGTMRSSREEWQRIRSEYRQTKTIFSVRCAVKTERITSAIGRYLSRFFSLRIISQNPSYNFRILRFCL